VYDVPDLQDVCNKLARVGATHSNFEGNVCDYFSASEGS